MPASAPCQTEPTEFVQFGRRGCPTLPVFTWAMGRLEMDQPAPERAPAVVSAHRSGKHALPGTLSALSGHRAVAAMSVVRARRTVAAGHLSGNTIPFARTAGFHLGLKSTGHGTPPFEDRGSDLITSSRSSSRFLLRPGRNRPRTRRRNRLRVSSFQDLRYECFGLPP